MPYVLSFFSLTLISQLWDLIPDAISITNMRHTGTTSHIQEICLPNSPLCDWFFNELWILGVRLRSHTSHEFPSARFCWNDLLYFQHVITLHYSGHEPAVAGLRRWWSHSTGRNKKEGIKMSSPINSSCGWYKQSITQKQPPRADSDF